MSSKKNLNYRKIFSECKNSCRQISCNEILKQVYRQNQMQIAFECSKGIKDMYEFKEKVRSVFEMKIKRVAFGMPNFVNFSGRILSSFNCYYSPI